ncbi:hypothetical protein Pelo_3068 [Pelomyxa schiedti]|nr:hypothetical protein Pelo_3068 [Pelomyxa schiedti]
MGQSCIKCVQSCGLCLHAPVVLNDQDDYWKPSKQLAAEMEAVGVDLTEHPAPVPAKPADSEFASATLTVSPAIPIEHTEGDPVGSPKKVKITFSKQ